MILQLEKLTPFRYWIAGGAFLAVVFLAGVQTVRLNAEQVAHERTKTSHAQVLQGLAEKTAAAYAAVEKATAAVREELAAADQKHTKEMSNARNENERLRAAARRLGHGPPPLSAPGRGRALAHRCPDNPGDAPQTDGQAPALAGPRARAKKQRRAAYPSIPAG